MLALVQRVTGARVDIDGATAGAIGKGLLVFLCAVKGDGDVDVAYTARKIAQLRIFEDPAGKMNLSVQDVQGEVLVLSQFTLVASTKKGNRPSFEGAEAPEQARQLYEAAVRQLRDLAIPVTTGVFAASMQVGLTNDGPVTILIDSRQNFP